MLLKTMLDYVKARYSTRSLDEKGQGVVEYALILAFVVVVAGFLMGGNNPISTAVQTVFGNVVDALGGGSGGGQTTPGT